jgi:hypothetical protein
VAIFRIEVADPLEGDALRAALRARGFVVVKRTPEELAQGSEAALVVLALDAPGAASALAAIRARSGPPCVLVGASPGEDASREAAAGTRFLRPVYSALLVQRVETLLLDERSGVHEAGDVLDASSRVSAGDAADASAAGQAQESPVASVVVRLGGESGPERTLRLDADGVPIALSAVVVPQREPAPGPDAVPPRERSSPGAESAATPSASAGAIESAISPRLQAMLVAAHARVFPGAAPLDLVFAAGHEPPDLLVPDELIEDVAASPDTPDEDPLESFTQIGPVVPQSGTPAPMRTPGSGVGSSRTPSPFTPRASRFDRSGGTSAGSDVLESTGGVRGGTGAYVGVGTPSGTADHGVARPLTTSSSRGARSGRATGEARSDEALSADRSVPDTRPPGARRRASTSAGGEPRRAEAVPRAGLVGDAGLVELFVRLALARADGELRLRELAPRSVDVQLELVDGEIRAISGDAALRVVAQLQRERRLAEMPADEGAAQQLLERRVSAGLLARFDLERRLARAREELLYALLAATNARYDLGPLDAARVDALRGTPLPLAGGLLARVVEGARRRLAPTRVAALLGPVRVRSTSESAARFAEAALAPELVTLFSEPGGALLESLVAAAPAEEGIAGAVFALVYAGALRVEAAPAASPALTHEAALAARAELAALAALAEDADYFAVLGVPRDVAPRELHAAHDARTRTVRALPLEAFGLTALEPVRAAVLAALDDALDVLADARLRARYASALEA